MTTYAVLASDYGARFKKKPKGDKNAPAELVPGYCAPLQQIHWWRIVLDESHAIKTSTNAQSQACQVLESSRRWCVSGTPMSNTTEDLVGQFKFLGLDAGLADVPKFKTLFGSGSGEPYGRKKSSYVPPGDLPALVSLLRR